MTDNEFPKAIIHVDGDAFFVACELTRRPDLKGKPVVTGEERRIATAMSYEAKKLGISRGMPVHEIKKNFPQVTVLSSHYDLYKMFSQRMFSILNRFTPFVEWYSIDECFADITGIEKTLKKPYSEIVSEIKKTLIDELGITFSLGLSVNKVLAKVASKSNKPNGLTIIPKSETQRSLENVPLGKIWGIGPSTTRYLSKFGISTAFDFVAKDRQWIEEHCPKPIREIWFELKGISVFKIHHHDRELPKSISSTETFWPSSSSSVFLLSEISRHVEDVAKTARDFSILASRFTFFIKTQDFRYRRKECVLFSPSNLPHEFMRLINENFSSIFDPNLVYRSAGVVLHGISPESLGNNDLFGNFRRSKELQKIYKVADTIAQKYGKSAVFLASSLSKANSYKSKRFKRKFAIPLIGIVK